MHISSLSLGLAAAGLLPAANAETLKQVWQRLAPTQYSFLALDAANNAWFENPSNLTIFASNDQSYVRFATDASASALQNPAILHESFQYLQVPGIYSSANISGKDIFLRTNLTDPSLVDNSYGAALIEVTKIGKSFQIFTGNPFPVNVISADNYFDGGVLHLVDYIVPAPQNITYTGAYRNLTALAQFAQLKPELDTAKDLTIFVPSDEALQALGRPLTVADVDHHCVPNNAIYTPFLGASSVNAKAYDGSSIEVSADGNGGFTANKVSFSTGANYTVDNLLLNGVVHVIDSVLPSTS